jgi:uncharacterized membrane protein YjgN (DUF898 family)
VPLGSVSLDLLPIGSPNGLGIEEQRVVTEEPTREVPLEFQGRAGEYFRIWIVNAVLTVVTFGIYAAWAKVRTRRYFYGNTLLDGKPFDFTGNPIAILKGNLIFGTLFVMYSVSSSMFPALGLFIFILILAIMPWMIQKAMRFRAHNTMYRNLRFSFRGSLGESYKIFLGLGILAPLTLGLIIPYIHFRQRKYIFGHMNWGNSAASMQGKPGFFYKTFFKVVAMALIAGIASSLIVPLVFATQMQADRAKAKGQGAAIMSQPTREQAAMAQVPESINTQTERENSPRNSRANLEVEKAKEDESLKAREFAKKNAAIVKLAFLMVVPMYLFFFLGFLYYQVRTLNYSLNSTSWDKIGRLESRIRTRDLAWIYLSNGLAILVSFGLMIPWALIRTARYRASRTVLHARPGSLDLVAQSAISADSALGDSGADIFDFEVGF